jgi:hypothetical protein
VHGKISEKEKKSAKKGTRRQGRKLGERERYGGERRGWPLIQTTTTAEKKKKKKRKIQTTQ